jgi:hypothetical protein
VRKPENSPGGGGPSGFTTNFDGSKRILLSFLSLSLSLLLIPSYSYTLSYLIINHHIYLYLCLEAQLDLTYRSNMSENGDGVSCIFATLPRPLLSSSRLFLHTIASSFPFLVYLASYIPRTCADPSYRKLTSMR